MTTTTTRPELLDAIDNLTAALLTARERALGRRLTQDDREVLALQVGPIVTSILELDPEAREYVLRTEVENLAQQIIDEELAAGRLLDHGDGSYERPAHLRGAGR